MSVISEAGKLAIRDRIVRHKTAISSERGVEKGLEANLEEVRNKLIRLQREIDDMEMDLRE